MQSSLIIIPTVPIRRITKGLASGVISSNNELHFYEKKSEQSIVRNISMEKIFESNVLRRSYVLIVFNSGRFSKHTEWKWMITNTLGLHPAQCPSLP